MATLADTMVFLSLGMALFAFNGSYDPVCIVIAIVIFLKTLQKSLILFFF